MSQTDPATMNELTPAQTAEALETLILAGQACLLRGDPGVGKSSITDQVRRRLLLDMCECRLSQNTDVDLGGVPFRSMNPVTGLSDGTDFDPPKWLPRNGWGVMFWDEINRGTQATQNAALQAILDNRIRDYHFPDGWVHVAAINPEGSIGSVGVTRMSQALNNRFVHINVMTDVDDWCKWAAGTGNSQPTPTIAQPIKPGSMWTGRISPVVIAFIRFRPALLHQPSRTDYAYPTPRSWAFVSRMLDAKPSPAVELALYAGAVGHGAAVEFLSFLRIYRTLPSIDGILLNPQSAPVPTDVATVYAVSAALATRITDGNFGRVLEYMHRVTDAVHSPEFEVFTVQDATRRDSLLCNTPEFIEWSVAHQDLMK